MTRFRLASPEPIGTSGWYRILGFFSPVPKSKWKVGSSVPVKVALGDAQGTRLTDAAASQLASACRVTFSASGAQATTGRCMTYEAATDQFVYVWKLDKRATGDVTVSTSVAYPGSSTTSSLAVQITITG